HRVERVAHNPLDTAARVAEAVELRGGVLDGGEAPEPLVERSRDRANADGGDTEDATLGPPGDGADPGPDRGEPPLREAPRTRRRLPDLVDVAGGVLQTLRGLTPILQREADPDVLSSHRSPPP